MYTGATFYSSGQFYSLVCESKVFLQCESLTGASDRVLGEGIWEVSRGGEIYY